MPESVVEVLQAINDVHFPYGAKAKGEVRTQFTQGVDMAPTVLDFLDLDSPTIIRGVTRAPIEGYRAHTFEDAATPPR